MKRTAPLFLLSALAILGCKNDPAPPSNATGALPPAASPAPPARTYNYRPASGCECGGFKLTWRVRNEDDDPSLEPTRRHYLLVEFLLEKEGKKFAIFPAAECAFPQRIYANKVQLGVACDERHYVVGGPHWASAFAIGKMSWTRRLDNDPSLPNFVTRPMETAGGAQPLQWGEAGGQRADPDKLAVTCGRLTTDDRWVQIVEWGGTPRWYDMLVGQSR